MEAADEDGREIDVGGTGEGSMQTRVQQLEVRFVTRMAAAKWQVPDAPLSVPADLGRYGLSEVVNAMLAAAAAMAEAEQLPWEFLIGGEMLRGKLGDFVDQRKISTETVLEIEYLPAVLPPKPRQEHPMEDWVRCVDAAAAASSSSSTASISPDSSSYIVMSGGYDGIARLWDGEGRSIRECRGHSAAITGVNILPTDFAKPLFQERVVLAVTGSKDGRCMLWRMPLGAAAARGAKGRGKGSKLSLIHI